MRVVRIQLFRIPTENNSVEDINKILWELQKEVRTIANRAVQLCYKNMIFEQEYHREQGEYPKKEVIKNQYEGKTLGGYIYNQVAKECSRLNTGCISATLNNVTRKFGQEKGEYLKGTRSIPSYKSNMPIDIPKKNIVFNYEQQGTAVKWNVTLSLLSNRYKKDVGEKKGQLLFGCVIRDRSSRVIMERCYDGIYDITASKLIYKDGKWFLNLGYNESQPDNKIVSGVEKENVCACFIGEYNAIYASNNTNGKVLELDGGEVEKYRHTVEAKKRALLKSRTACGDSYIGRGYHHRVKPVERYSEKISNFRDTMNHRYSRAIVDYAKNNKCGIIVIENLKGISERNKILKNWSYFDLQTKLQYKAKAANIEVVTVDGNSLKNICSGCGSLIEKMEYPCKVVNCPSCGKTISYDKNMSLNMITQYENNLNKNK